MKTIMAKILIAFGLLLFCVANKAITQNIFPATGRAGIYTTAPAASLQVRGGARIGTTANYLTIDSATGNLSFTGTSAYRVAGNKYAFQYSGNPNYGLYFNSTNVQYEFRNGSALPIFYVNANTGNSVFSGNVKIGAYTLPATDGTNGQALRTDGAGNISWATVSGGGGANTALSNLAATAVNVSLLPGTDSAKDIGSSLLSWKNIYLKSGLYFNGVKMMQYKPGVNTIIGENAGSTGSGGFNTAFGSNVLSNNTTGNSNVAIGENNFINNSIGSNNTSVGYGTMINNTQGYDNTANGFQALYNNTTGSGNTAVGKFSLFNSTIANENTATGIYSLYANTTGFSNTATGSYALQANTTGSNNTANGNSALYANTIGINNAAFGAGALSSNSLGSQNSATGYLALFANSTGSYNTADGNESLRFNTTGNHNTAVGSSTLRVNNADDNTAIGFVALSDNTTGYQNTATGTYSLTTNTTGFANTTVGFQSMAQNYNSNQNTAVGVQALYSIDGVDNNANCAFGFSALSALASGYSNTALGTESMRSITASSQNTAVGSKSLKNIITGTGNAAIGESAMSFNTSGNYNTALGSFSLNENRTGSNNTAIGFGSGPEPGKNNLENTVAIGYYATVGVSNMMMLGSSLVKDWGLGGATPAVGYCLAVGTNSGNGNGAKLTDGGTWTNASDKNLKEDFQKQDAQQILDKVNRMEITKWKYKGTGNEYHIGPMAQDFFAAFNTGIDDKSISTIDPAGVALLAIQALSKKNNDLEKNNKSLTDKIENLLKRVDQLEQSISQCCSKSTAISSDKLQTETVFLPSLEQNIPNPVNQSATINYTLPVKFSSAKIIVTDNNGKTMKQFTISWADKGSVIIPAGSLAGGLYHYALYVDGKMVDSKKMEIIR